MSVRIHAGDALETLRTLESESVHCCVTSPPYWGGLRDYGAVGQIGLERDPSDYVATLVRVFGEVRRTLREVGTLWLNVGEVYAASGKGGGGNCGDRSSWGTVRERKGFRVPPDGFKMKDQTLVPFMLADALRRDGWYLRSTIIWSKPAASEPMRLDRPAQAHEYVFLLSRSEHYAARDPGESWWFRTVWEAVPDRSPDHPATMPAEIVRRCILAGCPEGGTVLDPFGGAGTTGLVADRLDRDAVLIELNPEYAAMAESRIRDDAPMFVDVTLTDEARTA